MVPYFYDKKCWTFGKEKRSVLGNVTWQRFWMKEHYNNNKEFKTARIFPSKINMSLWSLVSNCFSFLLRLFLYCENMVSTTTLIFFLSPKKRWFVNRRISQTIYTCPESFSINVLVSAAKRLGRSWNSYEDVISLSTTVWSVIISSFSIF